MSACEEFSQGEYLSPILDGDRKLWPSILYMNTTSINMCAHVEEGGWLIVFYKHCKFVDKVHEVLLRTVHDCNTADLHCNLVESDRM